MPSILFTGLFFLIWDSLFTAKGVWQFNNKYVLGYYFFNLPMEEYLFFFTVPYACTFVFETVSLFVKKSIFPVRLRMMFILGGAFSILAAFLFLELLYTFWVLVLMGTVLILITRFLKHEELDKFLLCYFICLIPMFIVNGLLTGLPVLIYNNAENCGLRLGTIPIEDFGYNMILLCMVIGGYKYLQGKFETAKN
jgi:lycopene cyclase domain-containing protein